MKGYGKPEEHRSREKSTGKYIVKKPTCPFCGLPIDRPKELETRRPGEMPVGSCSCGAVYAYDATGHNLGAAFTEALVFGCNMDWDLAWGLLPEEDYLEKIIEHYDYWTHLVVPGGIFEGRRISGALYFIRMHEDIQEVTQEGVQKRLKKAVPASHVQANEQPGRAVKNKAVSGQAVNAVKDTLSKKEVETMVREYHVEPLLKAAGRDKRVIRKLQRLLYADDELIRLRTAEILGKVSAIIAKKEPGTISQLLQGLISSVLDSASSSWGAIDAAGEIIGNSPDIFAGYLPGLYQLLSDEAHQAKTLRAIGKTAKSKPGLIKLPASYFISYLNSDIPETRGYAALLLSSLEIPELKSELERIQNDKHEIKIYENGKIEKKTVGQLATKALEKIK